MGMRIGVVGVRIGRMGMRIGRHAYSARPLHPCVQCRAWYGNEDWWDEDKHYLSWKPGSKAATFICFSQYSLFLWLGATIATVNKGRPISPITLLVDALSCVSCMRDMC